MTFRESLELFTVQIGLETYRRYESRTKHKSGCCVLGRRSLEERLPERLLWCEYEVTCEDAVRVAWPDAVSLAIKMPPTLPRLAASRPASKRVAMERILREGVGSLDSRTGGRGSLWV